MRYSYKESVIAAKWFRGKFHISERNILILRRAYLKSHFLEFEIEKVKKTRNKYVGTIIETIFRNVLNKQFEQK